MKTYNTGKYILYSIFAWFGLSYQEIQMSQVLVLFMTADTLSGLIKSIHFKYNLSSMIMLKGVTVKFLLVLVPLLVAKASLAFNIDFKSGVHLVLGLLVANEFLSILANIQSVRKNKSIKNMDLFSWGIDALKRSLKKQIQSFIDGDNKNGICSDFDNLKDKNDEDSNSDRS